MCARNLSAAARAVDISGVFPENLCVEITPGRYHDKDMSTMSPVPGMFMGTLLALVAECYRQKHQEQTVVNLQKEWSCFFSFFRPLLYVDCPAYSILIPPRPPSPLSPTL